eukprot:3940412-Rhodomonas_salina.3
MQRVNAAASALAVRLKARGEREGWMELRDQRWLAGRIGHERAMHVRTGVCACVAMSSAGVRARCGMSGTALRTCYAKSGTDCGYGGTRGEGGFAAQLAAIVAGLGEGKVDREVPRPLSYLARTIF